MNEIELEKAILKLKMLMEHVKGNPEPSSPYDRGFHDGLITAYAAALELLKGPL